MIRKFVCSICFLTLFTGCASGPVEIPYEKIMAREQNNLALSKAELDKTYKKVKAQYIQASNHTQKCLLKFVGFDEDLANHTVYWDGKIKNGYANGLGRSFLFKDGILISEHLVNYKDDASDSEQYYMNNWKEGGFADSNNEYYVKTYLINSPQNFTMHYVMGEASDKTKKDLENGVSIVAIYPRDDVVIFAKQYATFTYVIRYDNNIFNELAIAVSELNREQLANGFVIAKYRNGSVIHGEVLNGSFVREVSLPIEYISKLTAIEHESRTVMNNAIQAQNEAIAIKNQYKTKICKTRRPISYMDDDLYYSLCDEDSILLEASQRLSTEKENLMVAKEREFNKNMQDSQLQIQAQHAQAAQRQADAAERQVSNSSNQNMILNNQLQQINNNLFLDRLGY